MLHALVVRARGLKPTDKFSSTADPFVALRIHAREATLPAPVRVAEAARGDGGGELASARAFVKAAGDAWTKYARGETVDQSLEVAKTDWKAVTIEPLWNERLRVELSDVSAVMELRVVDHNLVFPNVTLGVCYVALAELRDTLRRRRWIALAKPGSSFASELLETARGKARLSLIHI